MQKKVKMLFVVGTIVFLVGLMANNLIPTSLTSQKQLSDRLPKRSAPGITVQRPDTGLFYTAGYTMQIVWTPTGISSSVNIILEWNGNYNLTITNSAPSVNDQQNAYYWKIPSYQPPSSLYVVQVEDNVNTAIYGFSNYFTIHTYSWIHVTDPISGTWIAGSSHYIDWTFNATKTHVNITLYDNGLSKLRIATNASNNGAYYWHIPSTIPTDYYYQINITSLSVNDSGTYFSIIGNPTITQPADITYNQGATGNSISWTIKDTSIGVTGYTVYRNGTSVATSSWTNNTAVTITIDGLAAGSYNYTIVATNGRGGSSSDTVIVTVKSAAGVPFDGYTFLIIMFLSVGGLVAWLLMKKNSGFKLMQ